ncbi:hypothetical protein [Candidatus Magnetomonas plexicatena]|uniref:hypothetical protein n=1 Tax=Candidatus Magnetomonas plexicatena TaxID=2552947 RepID=UPI001101A01E|nr:hypothetical protein E2O03_000505 [Nitrospirales bacterium LBB_01]
MSRITCLMVLFLVFLSPGMLLCADDNTYRFGYLGNVFGLVGSSSVSIPWSTAFTSYSYFTPHDDLGFKWDRPHPGPFNRNIIERKKGVYDFTIPDAYVSEAQKRGISIVATIWPFVDWDQEYWEGMQNWEASTGWLADLPTSRYNPHDIEAYSAFVKALVERYNGDGLNDMPGLLYPIMYWEILNEPESYSGSQI